MHLDVPSPSAPPRLPHVPRLSIRYLLAWTTLTAAVLVALTQALNWRATNPWTGAVLVIGSMVVGWLYFATLLIWCHSMTDTLWPLEPGEWLILTASNAITLWLVLTASALHPYWLDLAADRPIHRSVVMLGPGQCAAVLSVAAIAQCRRGLWSALFVNLSLLCLMVYAHLIAERGRSAIMTFVVMLTACLFVSNVALFIA